MNEEGRAILSSAARSGRARAWKAPMLGVLVGTVLGAGLTSLPRVEGWHDGSSAVTGRTASEWQPRQLEREWRWSPKAVEFEFMYREEH